MLLRIISSRIIDNLVGFISGFYSQTHYLVPAIFILLVTFTMHTIHDLDNPLKGSTNLGLENLKLPINKH